MVELEDMTYGEVVRRMVDLMYVKHESRWIDSTLSRLTVDFIRRVEERFTSTPGKSSIIQGYSEMDNKPFETVDKALKVYSEASKQLINAQDVQHFLLLCQRRGQKPVPFVPCLDENFEFFFKKDSLWQSEDLEAVVDQDVGRTCILQGPTAAKYSHQIDEPVKDILDGIHNDHIAGLTKDVYHGDEASIPTVEYFGSQLIVEDAADEEMDGLTVSRNGNSISFRISPAPNATIPELEAWLHLLAGKSYSWRYALFTSDVFVQGQRFQTNPLKRVFAPSRGLLVEIQHPDDPSMTLITVKEPSPIGMVKTVEISISKRKDIRINLLEHRTASSKVEALPLKFTYHPEAGYAPIREVMDDRNDRIKAFYYRIWFGENEEPPWEKPATSTFEGGRSTVSSQLIADFTHAVGNTGEAFVDRPGRETLAPMDFAIILGWKAVTKPIFPRSINGDLLKLVHLSNGIRMVHGAQPLQKGDTVETSAQINAVVCHFAPIGLPYPLRIFRCSDPLTNTLTWQMNQDAGKMVEVCATLLRKKKPVMTVTSQFLYRGNYTDYENTFQRKDEIPMQVHLGSSKDVCHLPPSKLSP